MAVMHGNEIKGMCDLAEKHVFSQERMMRMNFIKKRDWLAAPKIRPGMPHWILYNLVYNTWSNEI